MTGTRHYEYLGQLFQRATTMSDRHEGFIARIREDRGFGFIRDTATQLEYFFHRSSCSGTPFTLLREGQKVSFKTEPEHEKGPRAVDVRVM